MPQTAKQNRTGKLHRQDTQDRQLQESNESCCQTPGLGLNQVLKNAGIDEQRRVYMLCGALLIKVPIKKSQERQIFIMYAVNSTILTFWL